MTEATTIANGLVRLTTDAVEDRHRMSLIGDVMARELAGADVAPCEQGDVSCEWTLAPLDTHTVLGFGWQSNLRTERNAGHVRDGDADFSLFTVTGGAVPFVQNDRHSLLAPGKALLIAHSRPVTSLWQNGGLTLLRLPRAALGHLNDIDAAGGMVIDCTMPGMRLLDAYCSALKPLGDVDALVPFAARHLAELTAYAVAEALGRHGGPRRDQPAQCIARLELMHQAIAAELGRPELSMAHVAARTGMSERAGYLLFEQAGKSFAETVYAMRLDRARDRLRSGYTGRLLDLALDVGFVDLSHFNRRFRARFGCTPGDLRRTTANVHQSERPDAAAIKPRGGIALKDLRNRPKPG